MIKTSRLAIVFALTIQPVHAQQPPMPAVDSLFAHLDRPNSPGCAMGVVRDHKLIYQRGYGMASLEHSIPNGSSIVYGLGSVSKQFTAAVIALLAGEGLLNLDDDIRKHLPEMPDYGRTITIRHLLHHTSGLRETTTLAWYAGLGDASADSATYALIRRQKRLTSPPGDKYQYSNAGYILLARIVQRVTGEPFSAVAKKRLFDPLGMTDTHVHDDPERVIMRRATPYRYVNGVVRHAMTSDVAQAGDAGVHSTVRDLALWDENFYRGTVGGGPLLTMLASRGILSNGDTLSYAFGNQHGSWRGLPIVEHTGRFFGGGITTSIMRFPTERFSVLLLCNVLVNPQMVARRVADVFLGDRMSPPPAPFTPPARPRSTAPVPWSTRESDFKAYEGDFYSEELDVVYHVRYRGGELRVAARGVPTQTFRPAERDLFSSGADCGLAFDRRGNEMQEFTLNCGVPATGIRFGRVALPRESTRHP